MRNASKTARATARLLLRFLRRIDWPMVATTVGAMLVTLLYYVAIRSLLRS